MHGNGNDFILIDEFNSVIISEEDKPKFVRAICNRNFGLGADGVLFVQKSEKAHAKFRYFNSDGSEAEMCGNGGRCVARYAYLKGIAGAKLAFETIAGIIRAEVKNRRVLLQMPLPTELRLNQSISVDGKNIYLNSINTGVPHAVVKVEDIEKAPVKDLGRKIRFHSAFQPKGTNVNFIQVLDVNHLVIRTYERGVEDETLACGTGAVGSALVAAALEEVNSPVEVKTRGGEVLAIHFQKESDKFSQVFLEGDTCLVFEGVLGEDVWDQYEKMLKQGDSGYSRIPVDFD